MNMDKIMIFMAGALLTAALLYTQISWWGVLGSIILGIMALYSARSFRDILRKRICLLERFIRDERLVDKRHKKALETIFDMQLVDTPHKGEANELILERNLAVRAAGRALNRRPRYRSGA
jgi:hypothetical protein